MSNESSITRASIKLHVTQPTISKQLGDLEHKLGTVCVDKLHNKRCY